MSAKLLTVGITSSMSEEEEGPPQAELCATKEVVIQRAEEIVKQLCEEQGWDWDDYSWT